MPSMSLSDCQSLTLNVKMGLSQFFRNSHSKESGYFTARLTARWRGGPLGPDGEGRRKKKRRPTVRGGGYDFPKGNCKLCLCLCLCLTMTLVAIHHYQELTKYGKKIYLWCCTGNWKVQEHWQKAICEQAYD